MIQDAWKDLWVWYALTIFIMSISYLSVTFQKGPANHTFLKILHLWCHKGGGTFPRIDPCLVISLSAFCGRLVFATWKVKASVLVAGWKQRATFAADLIIHRTTERYVWPLRSAADTTAFSCSFLSFLPSSQPTPLLSIQDFNILQLNVSLSCHI